MPIVATNMIKLNVERRKAQGKLTVNNNINIEDIQEMNLSLGDAKQSGLRFLFKYTSEYTPDAASMAFEGEVLYIESKEKTEKIKKDWDAKKPIESDVMVQVMNSALQKSTVLSLNLSSDMGLPPPVKLPHVSAKEQKKE